MNALSTGFYHYYAEAIAQGLPLFGYGMECHIHLDHLPNLTSVADNMRRFSALGVQIHITELDVSTNNTHGSAAELYVAVWACTRSFHALTRWTPPSRPDGKHKASSSESSCQFASTRQAAPHLVSAQALARVITVAQPRVHAHTENWNMVDRYSWVGYLEFNPISLNGGYDHGVSVPMPAPHVTLSPQVHVCSRLLWCRALRRKASGQASG